MFERIVLASGNQGKLREFSKLFAEYNIQIQPQSDFNVPECPEPHCTFVENAIAKARHAAKHSGLPALADDSGICAEALNGAPGVLSARFAGDNPKSDAANNTKLSAELADKSNKRCYYVCILVLVRHEHDPQPIIAEGIWHGTWQAQPSGGNGFGYDPHFYLADQGCTAAELDPETKNRLSHRGLALQELMKKIRQSFSE
ncbi:RdgB/HAM1 family non-canonical purine NTP pyrophosphatase [Neisseria weaveri]|uniref:dITP/XTP pyrophosphatase n=1 Tax=Neisseria weaveri TaxID=28091 RepID=A0A448VKF7_9NEIS|nr:RdgB/HAM1 family non-canonical purine NTP pyrophosphatase [Neisseria weaveri]EGV36296.1 non-canonical purine NTP pyrophosphatase, RdgB/HAM1 family [Neisseria weaveri ATCC 51223]EGV38895.1 non-canonical purine NTP pyrophosphatase, RdgB/HAM1 family [Neisseria weaveri LMG 5135]SAY51323.1 deoxyribonucleotide triphosphate pyrophosphatase [Neisseria weaveri]VEJ50247.1 deoxyribonucleotide triphosphate pyrophosphatase [Neisseria weaveri]